MIILGIETSCDETAAAVLTNNDERITILSNVVASSATLQAKYGGIIPEQAAREQIKSIVPVIEEALIQSNLYPPSSKHHLPSSTIHPPAIDAIAVTYGPGLIGSLLVGVETAKALALVWNKPLIPVNHLIGHFYANWITQEKVSKDGKVSNVSKASDTSDTFDTSPAFPCLGLLVSGGHTDLVLFTNHGKYKYLGGTRDDATGECFDKCARLLGLPYPGGPEISKLATKGDASRFKLPIPMKGNKSLDFSYSGLKTSVWNMVYSLLEKQNHKPLTIDHKQNLAASIENTIVQSLIDKVMLALKVYPVKNVLIAGGVAANKKLATSLQSSVFSLQPDIRLFVPPPALCTDNAAMIAAAAFFQKPIKNPLKLQADPNLSL